MSLKQTLVLLVIFATLGAYVLFVDQKVKPTEDRLHDGEYIVPGFEPTQATRVAIRHPDHPENDIVLVASGGTDESEPVKSLMETKPKTWSLEKPVADKADGSMVQNLLYYLAGLKPTKKLEGAEAASAEFGKPEIVLEVSRPEDKGGDFAVELGTVISGSTRLARVKGKPEVYWIQGELSERLQKNTFDYRNKVVLQLDRGQGGWNLSEGVPVETMIAEIAAVGTNAPRRMEVHHGQDGFWHLGSETGDTADPKTIDDVLDKTNLLHADAIPSEKPSPAELTSWHLSPPEAVLTVVGKGGKTATLSLGGPAPNGTRYVLVSGHDWVYTVDVSMLRPLLEKVAGGAIRSDELFPTRAALSGQHDSGTLDAKSTESELIAKLAMGEWSIEAPIVAKGDKDAFTNVLKAITETKVTWDLDDPAGSHGVSTPTLVITLTTGGAIHTLSVGEQVAGKPAGTHYVRRDQEPHLLVASLVAEGLGDLAVKLGKEAALVLHGKTFLSPKLGDALGAPVALTLTEASGVKRLDARKKDLKKDGEWQVVGSDGANEKFTRFVLPLEDLKSSEIVAVVASASIADIASYGLDPAHALKLDMTVAPITGEAKPEDKVILLGKRIGGIVYAEDDKGTVVGKVEARFLDHIALGFAKEQEIFRSDTHDATGLVVTDGKTEVLRLEKRPAAGEDVWYLGSRMLDGPTVSLLVSAFSKIDAYQTESATDQARKDKGLDPPARRVTVISKNGDKTESTTLLVSAKIAPDLHVVHVMKEGGLELGEVSTDEAGLEELDDFMSKPQFTALDQWLNGVGGGGIAPVDTNHK